MDYPALIIFTVTNKVTKQVYVGSTRNELDSQWARMVAAALQDLDYPLYRDIRIQGEENFIVEEWDSAESREELCELEQDALEFFGAMSLKGYKTSTVKILPKKKTRPRKSTIERELTSIFDDLIYPDDDTPPSIAIKKEFDEMPSSSGTTEKTTVKRESAKLVNNSAIDVKKELAQITKSEEVQSPPEAPPKAPKNAGSRANAMVKMKSIELSDDITAQLAAITAAADACLTGDASAVEQLISQSKNSGQPETTASVTNIHDTPVTPVAVFKETIEEKIEEPVCPKQLRIREAIERHRKQRAQQSSEARENERNRMASMLAELDARARELYSGTFAAVA